MTESATTMESPETASPALPSEKQSAILFWLALVWLLMLGLALHIYERVAAEPEADLRLFWWCLGFTGGLWLVFIFDGINRLRCGTANRAATIGCFFLPALRLGLRDPQEAKQLWLPGCGWQRVDINLQERVEKWLRGPMLGVSLAVLPLLAAEYLATAYIEHHPAAKPALMFGTAMIWWAFTVEFILMISITDQKLKYVKAHWLDLVIILLPLITFLQALRLSRLARLQQLTKTTRLYRFRSVAMKTYRALLLIDAVARLIQGSPQKRLTKLREQLQEREEELAQMRREITALEAQLVSTTTTMPQGMPVEG